MTDNFEQIIRIYDDGGKEILEGEDLKNYEENMKIALSLVAVRNYIKLKPVKWK